MKKRLIVSLCLTVCICFALSIGVNSETDAIQSNIAQNKNANTEANLRLILDESTFNLFYAQQAAQEIMARVAEANDEFAIWKDSEIVQQEVLHSYETGEIEAVVFDTENSDGECAYIIIGVDSNGSYVTKQYAKCKSYYRLYKAMTLVETADLHEDYYFYGAPFAYGYGILTVDNTLDIYNIQFLYENNLTASTLSLSKNANYINTEEIVIYNHQF